MTTLEQPTLRGNSSSRTLQSRVAEENPAARPGQRLTSGLRQCWTAEHFSATLHMHLPTPFPLALAPEDLPQPSQHCWQAVPKHCHGALQEVLPENRAHRPTLNLSQLRFEDEDTG